MPTPSSERGHSRFTIVTSHEVPTGYQAYLTDLAVLALWMDSGHRGGCGIHSLYFHCQPSAAKVPSNHTLPQSHHQASPVNRMNGAPVRLVSHLFPPMFCLDGIGAFSSESGFPSRADARQLHQEANGPPPRHEPIKAPCKVPTGNRGSSPSSSGHQGPNTLGIVHPVPDYQQPIMPPGNSSHRVIGAPASNVAVFALFRPFALS
ncbi:uncharacterized protein BDZ83DRAFT_267335 [Colletotrichum acutatum]|uniref:Uncharacterized protein n=1 Tax=Glomerella acutata TaxID=27357 RepID=A0AAD8UMR2_GLOAC|nr:uncharacterized protein BDZ83DRAFT_267335 [Colletotrichum acutatum]KAK1726228.1 hypothetical protein BDZ83DRAFT_267335 [Colletotrichum acutatum]